jgi:hypothetical protein
LAAVVISDRRLICSFILPVALLAALSCAGCEAVLPEPKAPTTDQPSAVAAAHEELRDLTVAEKAILADGFAAGLNDPDSAKFRWAKVSNRLTRSRDDAAWAKTSSKHKHL